MCRQHTSYLSREPRVYPCKFFLAGVNFYRFNAKSWHFQQIQREKLAFFGVYFILQKFCPCKKNDKYEVCSQSIGGVDAFSQLTCSEECGKLSMGIWDWFARHALNANQNEMHVSTMRWMEGFNQAACRLKSKSLSPPGRPYTFSPTRLKSLDATRKVQTGMWTSEGQELYSSGRLVFREMFRIDTK